jgi:predicted lipoprotein
MHLGWRKKKINEANSMNSLGPVARVTKLGLQHRRALCSVAVLAGAVLLAGCKVVTIEQDQAIRAKQSLNFNADTYVASIWRGQALPALRARATPAKGLFAAIDANPEQAGARLGRRTGEGAAWNFVVSGEGVVAAVDDATRRRTVEVRLDAPVSRVLRLQTGPVVVGTSLRDALPFIAFDDFTDQLAYADVGRALTRTSLSQMKPTLEALKPGDRVRFVGAFDLPPTGQPVLITPVSIDKVAAS